MPNRTSAVSFKHILSVILIFFIGSGISIGTFFFLSIQEQKQIKAQFIIDAKDRYNAIKAETRQNRTIVQALVAFFYSSTQVGRREFNHFAKGILKDQPNIEAVQWVNAVKDQDRAAYEQRMKDEGFPDFEIKEIAPDGRLQRAAARAEYYPVQYVEPFESHQELLGLDAASVAVNVPAMQTARGKNKSISTPRISLRLAQPGDISHPEEEIIRSGRFGFQVFHPIFDTDGGTLKGYVAALLNSKETVVKAMKSISPVGIDIYYYDMSDENAHRLLYYWPSSARDENDAKKLIHYEDIPRLPGIYWTNKIEVIGRMRYLLFVPTSLYFQGKHSALPLLLAGSMWIITLMMAFYFYHQVRRTAVIERMVEERTDDLQKANEKLVFEVAERKKAEKAAQEVARLKSEFASTVSHELRTPLTVIKGGIDVVNDEVLGSINAEQKDMLSSIKNNVDRLSRLINDVLDYQKLEAGRVRFVKNVHELNGIVKQVCSDASAMAEKKGLKFVADIPPESLNVECDKDKIIQVIFNLLNNACKFTPQGTITARLERIGGGSAQVSVIDHGPGIRTEDKAKLFQTFSQLETVETRQTGGTGLGLSICKKIIEGHGGTIGVDSVYGRGATFYFTLKLKGADVV